MHEKNSIKKTLIIGSKGNAFYDLFLFARFRSLSIHWLEVMPITSESQKFTNLKDYN